MDYTKLIVEDIKEASLDQDGNWNLLATIRNKRSADGISWDVREFQVLFINKSLEKGFEDVLKAYKRKLMSCNGSLFNDSESRAYVEYKSDANSST